MAVRIGQSMGGARVYVPAKAAHDHPLTLVPGENTAQKLCNYYCGDTIEVPCKEVFRRIRDDIISREYHTMERGGNRANTLALEYAYREFRF